jgi:hypothetical protein
LLMAWGLTLFGQDAGIGAASIPSI